MTNRRKTAAIEVSPHKTSVACLRRLPAYLQMLRALQAEGREYVSGTVLASVHHLEPVIVRKDLAATGATGTPRLGFRIANLIDGIERFLGWDRRTKAVVVGCGNLGSSLLGYRRFDALGLEIVGAFDRDARKVGHMIHDRQVLPITDLAKLVESENVTLGLLAVPAAAAQETAFFMVECGIRGIWNFAPVKLKLPAGVIVQKEDLAEGLAVLAHRLYHAAPAAANSLNKRPARTDSRAP
jgi:redox-sensing transcriptional repressor